MLIVKRLLSHIPTKLPVGVTEFNAWADSIIELAGPYADRDSMVWAISQNLIHLPHTTGSAPKAFFVNSLRKAASNQIASHAMMVIKEDQEKRKQAEATAAQEAVANVEQK